MLDGLPAGKLASEVAVVDGKAVLLGTSVEKVRTMFDLGYRTVEIRSHDLRTMTMTAAEFMEAVGGQMHPLWVRVGVSPCDKRGIGDGQWTCRSRLASDEGRGRR